MKKPKTPSDLITAKLTRRYPDWVISIWNVRRKRGTNKTYRYDMQMHPKRGWLGGYIDDCEITL